GAMLAHVANLQCGSISQLVLNREIPLISKRRLHFGVPNSDQCARKGIARRAYRRQTIFGSRSRKSYALILHKRLSSLKRWIHWQTQVGSRAFEVGRDGKRTSHHGLAAQSCRRPGKTDTRLECLAAIYAVVQAAAAVPAGGGSCPQVYLGAVWRQHFSARQIEIDLPIILLHPRCKGFVTNAQVKSQTTSGSPVILNVTSDRAGAMCPNAAGEA